MAPALSALHVENCFRWLLSFIETQKTSESNAHVNGATTKVLIYG